MEDTGGIAEGEIRNEKVLYLPVRGDLRSGMDQQQALFSMRRVVCTILVIRQHIGQLNMVELSANELFVLFPELLSRAYAFAGTISGPQQARTEKLFPFQCHTDVQQTD